MWEYVLKCMIYGTVIASGMGNAIMELLVYAMVAVVVAEVCILKYIKLEEVFAIKYYIHTMNIIFYVLSNRTMLRIGKFN